MPNPSQGGPKGVESLARSKTSSSGSGPQITRRLSLAAAALVVALASLAAHVDAAPAGAKSYVAPSLLETAKQHPNSKVRVIVQSAQGAATAESAVVGAGGMDEGDKVGRRLGIVRAVSAVMQAKRVAKLAERQGLVVTPDAPARGSDLSSEQLWPYESGNAQLWAPVDEASPSDLPAIAIVDSGIDATRADVAGQRRPRERGAELGR